MTGTTRVKLEPDKAFCQKFTYIFISIISELNKITFIWFFSLKIKLTYGKGNKLIN